MSNPFLPAATSQTAVSPFGAQPNGALVPSQGIPAQGGFPAQNKQAIDDIDLDTDVKISQLDRIPKLKLNETARIAFVVFNMVEGKAPSPRFKKIMEFGEYKGQNDPRNVRFIAPEKNAELMVKCAARYGEPKTKFGTVLLQYDTDQHGQMLPNGGYNLRAFVFGVDKWGPIKQLHNEWGLHQHDLLMNCTEVNFQKLTITPAKECLWRSISAEAQQDIIQKASNLFDNHLNRLMGYNRSDAEIQQILNGQIPGAGAMQPVPSAINPFGGPGVGAPGVAAFSVPQQQPAPFAPTGAAFSDLVANGTQGPAANPAETPAA